MKDAHAEKDVKPQAPGPEAKQEIDQTPQPRELTPEEIKAVAGGPIIRNGS